MASEVSSIDQGGEEEVRLEHQTEVDVSTGDKRIADEDNRHGGDRHELGQFAWPPSIDSNIWRLRPISAKLPSINLLEQRSEISELIQDLLKEIRKEDNSLNCLIQAPRPSVRSSTSDSHYKIPGATHIKINSIQNISPEVRGYLRSLWDQTRPYYRDLKPSNVLLDEKTQNQLSDFGLSSSWLLHANDYSQKRMGSVVPSHNGLLDDKFLGKPSAKHGIEIKFASHITRLMNLVIFSMHHHPVFIMLPSARKWSGDMVNSCERLIKSKRIFANIFNGWIFQKPKYETPSAGLVSVYFVRKLFGIRNGLTVHGSQRHSEPDSRRSGQGKIVNTKTSASWIVATGAPHHATGDRNLLSGFTMEHDDVFVHAVNRVPMKVLARGAVVTDALILPDVWFVPGLTENLVSVSQLAELDHSIGFGRGECCIRSGRDANIIGKGRLQKDGQYVLDYLKIPLAI